MGVRLKGISKSQAGTEFTVEIHDADFSGTPLDIRLNGNGFDLNYDTEEDEPTSPILSSSMEFGIIGVRGDDEDDIIAFNTDLLESDEGRFRVRVLRGTSIFWAGYIITDTVYLEDPDWAAPAIEFRIRAIDGLGRLEAIDFNDDGSPYEGRESMIGMLFKVLDKIGLDDMWGSGEVFLRTINRFYELGMDATTSDDVFNEAWLDHIVFQKKDREGVITYNNCYEVLKYLLQMFLCRFYISDGCYRIDQIPEYKQDGSIFQHRYNNAGTKLGTTSGVSYVKDEALTPTVRIDNTRYYYYPALREASLKYGHLNDRNLTQGAVFSNSNTGAKPIIQFVHDCKLWFRGSIRDKLDFTSLGTAQLITPPARVIYQIKVRVRVDGVDYYLKRGYSIQSNNVVVYTPAEWTESSSDNLIFVSDIISLDSLIYVSQVDFLTPQIPGSADFVSVADFIVSPSAVVKGSTAQDPLTYTHTWDFFNSVTKVVVDDESILYNEAKYTRKNLDSPNASKINEYDTPFGDAYNFFTSSTITLGASTVTTSRWNRGLTGAGQKLQTLFLEELMKIRKFPLERLEGDVYGPGVYAHHMLKLINARQYAMLRGKFNSIYEIWSGVWFYTNTSNTITNVTVDIVDVPPGFEPGFEPPTPPPEFEPISNVGDDPPSIFIVFPNGSQTATTTSAGIDRNTTVTSIPINPIGVDGLINAGDEIAVVDPITGITHIFTVTDDVLAADTEILVSSDGVDADFNEGSVIVLPTDTFINNLGGTGGGGDCLRAFRQNFPMSGGESSVTVTVNGGDLPAADYIDVYYNGILLCPTDDWSKSGSNIVFNGWEAESDTKITVRFWASEGCKTRYVEKFSLSAGQSAVTVTVNAGVLPGDTESYLAVHYNGTLLEEDTDYTVSGSNINLLFGAEGGTKLLINFWI
jgi:hypothetical protein